MAVPGEPGVFGGIGGNFLRRKGREIPVGGGNQIVLDQIFLHVLRRYGAKTIPVEAQTGLIGLVGFHQLSGQRLIHHIAHAGKGIALGQRAILPFIAGVGMLQIGDGREVAAAQDVVPFWCSADFLEIGLV